MATRECFFTINTEPSALALVDQLRGMLKRASTLRVVPETGQVQRIGPELDHATTSTTAAALERETEEPPVAYARGVGMF